MSLADKQLLIQAFIEHAILLQYCKPFVSEHEVIAEKNYLGNYTLVKLDITRRKEKIVVTTVINHPNKGETMLARTGFSFCDTAIILNILENPRIHCPSHIKSWYLIIDGKKTSRE